MDYENYALPALSLARARIAASGGCRGCPTCSRKKGSGMFMGGAVDEDALAAAEDLLYEEEEKQINALKQEIATANRAINAQKEKARAEYIRLGQPIPKDLIKKIRKKVARGVYFGPRMATKAQLAAMARKDARAAARAERNACFTNCRTAYQSTLPARRASTKPRSAAQLANDERLRKMGKARRKRPLGIQQTRRNRNRGRGLETGNGLDYGSGMQYY
jgi:hypothetical protein